MAVPGSSSKYKEQGPTVRFILESRRQDMQALDFRCAPKGEIRPFAKQTFIVGHQRRAHVACGLALFRSRARCICSSCDPSLGRVYPVTRALMCAVIARLCCCTKG